MSFNKGIFKDNTSLWVEKYRPKTLDEYIGNKELKDKLKEFIKKQDISNLLLEGTAGGGKSSAMNLLVREIDCDYKYINASNERGIDTVRGTILNFCTSVGFSPLKILTLDEFSSFSPDGQNALKAVIEQYAKHTRFILTCNNVEQIIEPIRSRCQEFKVVPPSKSEVLNRCCYILEQEKVVYDKDDVVAIVDFAYPDIRKCIQGLQQHTTENTLRLSKEYFKLLKYQDEIVDILKVVTEKNLFDKVTEIRQLLADSKVKEYTQLYRYLFDKIDTYVKKEKIIKVIFHLEEGLKYDSFIADKEINIIATLLKIADELANV